MDTTLQKNILKTGAKLFLKYGLRSVSIDDICNELHISKKTFYTYFSQKEELVEAVLLDIDQKKQKKHGPKYLLNGNVIDRVMAFSVSQILNRNNQCIKFFFDLIKYYPEIHRRQVQRSHKEIHENIRASILDGMKEGLFRKDLDLDIMTEFISIQIMTVMSLFQQDGTKNRRQPAVGFLIDTILRLLCNAEGLAYYLEKKTALDQARSSESNPPLRDDEIDSLVDQLMDNTDTLNLAKRL